MNIRIYFKNSELIFKYSGEKEEEERKVQIIVVTQFCLLHTRAAHALCCDDKYSHQLPIYQKKYQRW